MYILASIHFFVHTENLGLQTMRYRAYIKINFDYYSFQEQISRTKNILRLRSLNFSLYIAEILLSK